MNIRSVINAIEDFAPRALQESYDNAGLQAGDATNICTGVLLTLDVNENTVTEAKEYGLNCIISHHPLLFKGIKSISPDTPTGRILIDAISNGITIYSAHTSTMPDSVFQTVWPKCSGFPGYALCSHSRRHW